MVSHTDKSRGSLPVSPVSPDEPVSLEEPVSAVPHAANCDEPVSPEEAVIGKLERNGSGVEAPQHHISSPNPIVSNDKLQGKRMFVLPVICCVCYLTSVVAFIVAHRSEENLASKILQGCLWGFLFSVFNPFTKPIKFYAAKAMYVYIFKISSEDHDRITGPRDSWTDERERFAEKYGSRRIKVADAINRRINHIWNFILRYSIFFPAIEGKVQVVMAVSTEMLFSTTLKLMVCRFCDDWYCNRFFFRSARIRDGRLGRLNLIFATFTGVATYPLCIVLVQAMVDNPGEGNSLMRYIFQAVTWGDTFAEIVGSAIGRITFPVKGFGEVNKKSVEGAIACFLSSLAALYATAQDKHFPSDSAFKVPIWIVHILSASLATIAETFSLRSTDNATMVLVVVAVLASSLN